MLVTQCRVMLCAALYLTRGDDLALAIDFGVKYVLRIKLDGNFRAIKENELNNTV